MSALISSAVGAKKAAAPKGGSRRRPVVAKAATPISVSSAQTSVAPPSPPPPTQLPDTLAPLLSTPSTAPAVSPSEPRAPSQPVEDASRQPTPITISAQPTPSESQARTPTPARSEVAATETVPVDSERESTQGEIVVAAPSNSKKRRRDAVPAKATAQANKRVKRSSARSNATVQASVQEEEPNVAPTRTTRKTAQNAKRKGQSAIAKESVPTPAGKSKAKRKPRQKSAATVVDSDAEDDSAQVSEEQEETEQSDPQPRRRRRKKRQSVQRETAAETRSGAEDGEEAEEQEEDDDDDDSDPELHEIDPTKKTMFEVINDRRHGKRSDRDKEMDEIDWVEVAQKRREANEKAVAAATATTTNQPLPSSDIVETTEGPGGTAEPRSSTQPPENRPATGTVQLRIVNGQIVEDESNLTIDRQARAEAEAQAANSEPITEETDLTARLNRTTYLNDRRRDLADRVPNVRRKSDPWSDEETDRFYDALRMFGTDFGIIAAMFAPKTRRQIKLKFTREERLDPARINAALMGKETKPMDLEHYAREAGRDVGVYTKYDGLQHVETVIKASMQEREAAMRKVIEDEEEVERQMREQQALKEVGKRKGREKKGRKAVAAAEGGGGRGGRKKGKAGATMGGGGPAPAEGAEVGGG